MLGATPGDVIADRFTIDRHIGAGGMGVVYRAIDTETNAPVALKLVHGTSRAIAERFEREASVLAGLAHPCIVSYLAHGRAREGALYLAMEWLDGEDLAMRLESGPLSVLDAIAVARSAARALGAASASGVVHRDVKPSNLFLVDCNPSRTKLLDFGVARVFDASALTQSGALLGTPLYMAPEQIQGRGVDARTDVFALGAVLFQCLTGKPPFPAESLPALVAMLVSAEPATRVRTLAPRTPPALDELVAKMLSKNAADRPRDATEVAERLERIDANATPELAIAETTAAPSPTGSFEEHVAKGMKAYGERRWADARAELERAIAIRDDADLRMLLSEIVWWLGDGRANVQHAQQAYAMFRKSDDPRAKMKAAMLAMLLAVNNKRTFGNEAACRGWIARAGRLLGSEPGPLHAMYWTVQAAAATDPTVAEKLAERAVEHARALGDGDGELIALATLGSTRVALGKVDDGLGLIDEAMTGIAGGEFERLSTVIPTTCSMVIACDYVADVTRMVRWCRVADEVTTGRGSPLLFADCRAHYGSALLTTGAWTDAERELTAARDAAPSDTDYHALAGARLAELRALQGRLADAEKELAPIADRHHSRPVAAMLELAAGRHSLAIALLQRYIDAAGSNALQIAGALDLLVDANVGAGDLEAARSASTKLSDLARAHGAKQVLAHALFAEGRLSAASGDVPEGRKSLERAADAFASVNAPFDAARARLALAKLLAQDHADVASREARAAKSAFDRLGAKRDADVAENLLVTLGGARVST